ncbi:MAG: sulfite exporter TauE/SafE family protein [Trueperaceae bacterium]
MFSLPEYPIIFWLFATFVALLIGVDKSGFGGGISVIAVPLLALIIPPADASALVLPVLIFGDILAFRNYRKTIDAKTFKLLLPCLLLGVFIGLFFFRSVIDDKRVLNVGVAVISLGFVVFQLTREALFKRLEHHPSSKVWGAILGVAAGFTSMIAHVGGPLVTVYLLPQNLGRDYFIGTGITMFFITNLVKLPLYGFLGLLHLGNALTILLLLPFTYVGSRLGLYLNRRCSNMMFNRAMYVFMTLTAVQLLFRN